jgi:hypothetical protein
MPRKLRHRHQLDCGYADLRELGQMCRRGLESAFGRERADVELVDHELGRSRRS